MKAGYTVVDAVSSYDTIVEVINRESNNRIVHLGWINASSPYELKNQETVGVWKIKKLKN